MGKPAARMGDMHTCPMVTGLVPHVGGPVMGPCIPTVLIGKMPAAVVGDICTCVGPPDVIAMGSTGVLIGGKPAARMGDITAHGGSIVVGYPTVLIGEVSPSAPPVILPPVTVLSLIGTANSITTAANKLRDAMKIASTQAKPKIAQKENLKRAAANGTPFCALCEKKKEEEEKKKKSKTISKINNKINPKAAAFKETMKSAAKKGNDFVQKCY